MRLSPKLGLLSLALLLSACSLAGDVTPPPGFPTLGPAGTPRATAAAPTAAPIVEPLLPETRPVSFDGGAVYHQHCAACHGPTGSGGGSMSAQLPQPPPDFANPETLREKTPQELFTVVTQGRLDRFMPPFGDSLSVAERWNAVAYLYTLSVPEAQRAAGEAVYAAQCASCHGETGQGDGPEAAALDTPPPDLSSHEYAAIRTAADYAAVLASDDPLHAFAAELSEADRWAVVDYARSLAYDYSPPEAVLAEREGAVRGQVVNGTAGAAAPGGLTVTLHSFEGNALLTTLTTTAAADGAFGFDAVAFAPGRQFVVVTQYQGVDYSSQPAEFGAAAGDEAPALEVELPVFETTSDRSVLAVPQSHLFLEFTQPGQVTVGVLYTFSNRGDQTVAALGDNPLQFTLPAGATDLNVQGGQLNETYFLNDRGFAVLWTVPPGEATSQILFSYRLPYPGQLSFAQPVDFPVEAVNLLVADLNVTVTGDALMNQGPQVFQGEQFQNFIHGPLGAGQQLAFEVRGEPGATVGGGATAPNPLADTSNLAVGLGALGVTLLALGFLLYRRKPAAPRSREDLLQALAELDDEFAAGDVPEADYRRERTQLKEELTLVWRKDEG